MRSHWVQADCQNKIWITSRHFQLIDQSQNSQTPESDLFQHFNTTHWYQGFKITGLHSHKQSPGQLGRKWTEPFPPSSCGCLSFSSSSTYSLSASSLLSLTRGCRYGYPSRWHSFRFMHSLIFIYRVMSRSGMEWRSTLQTLFVQRNGSALTIALVRMNEKCPITMLWSESSECWYVTKAFRFFTAKHNNWQGGDSNKDRRPTHSGHLSR